MQCRLNQEKYLRKYSVKKHKEKPDRVYLAYKKVDNNRIEKEKRKVANDYLTQTLVDVDLTSYRKMLDNRTVRRNVTLPNRLNQEAEKAHVNVSKVLQEALMARLGVSR